MNKTLPLLLSVILFFALSCPQRAMIEPGSAAPEKTVTITISDSGTCTITDPGDVTLTRNTDKIRWCIVYNCKPGGVRVVIDDFHDATLSMRSPFGSHSASDNVFDIGPLNPGANNCNKVSKVASTNGSYKYRITVIGSDGSVIAQKDPRVVISD